MRPMLAALGAALLTVTGCTTSGAGSHSSAPPLTSAPAPSPASLPPTSTAPATPVSSSSPSSLAPLPAPKSFPLNGLQVADLSFVGEQGWALGTVGCVQTSGRCPALAHTTDSGRTWHSLATPKVHVAVDGLGGSCAAPSVGQIRFATTRVGYLFGGGDAGVLLTSVDGGRSWHRQAGTADALESLDGNVIRIADRGGCPPGCAYTVELAAIGASDWRPVVLPGRRNQGDGVTLARTGSHAYLVSYGNPAGGAEDERSVLWSSADDGRHWVNRGEPCPQGGREVDTAALTTAPDGAVTVLCRGRGSQTQFVATSVDGGARFTTRSRVALGSAPVGALGTPSAATVVVSSDDTYRSTDGGRHFRRAPESPGALSWLGFASDTVGHAISVDRRTIWTTTDAGRTWRAARLR